MNSVILGRTGIKVNKNGFGCLPIQRDNKKEAISILRQAYNAGINFYDTARAYSDSEEKLGDALCSVRQNVYYATKSMAQNPKSLLLDLDTSLKKLKTDYIDIYQFHMAKKCFSPDDGSGMYEFMTKAKKAGKIRFIGLTTHSLSVANEAVLSNLYDTLQFPVSYISSPEDIKIISLCKQNNVGCICMKALAGGLITHSDAAYAYIKQFDNALPIWGIQKIEELNEFIYYQNNEPIINDDIKQIIEDDRKTLSGDFCRGCGYCMPCPAGINIPTAARMSLLLRRGPSDIQLTEEIQNNMKHIDNCIGCGYCTHHCPYNLNVPQLLKKNYIDYKTFL